MTLNATTDMKSWIYKICIVFFFVAFISCEEESGFSFDTGGTSNSGSIARFHITDTHLYVVEWDELIVFDIRDFDNVEEVWSGYIGWEVETIFRFDKTLFLGTQSGVLFYDISNAEQPVYVSSYEHVTACDPVVTDGEFAYSTLRSGSGCGGNQDLLDVIDVRDISYPHQISSLEMDSPEGLTLFGDWLYVGEGRNGMKVFDVSNPNSVQLLHTYSDIPAKDFIRDGNNLIIATESGLVQASVQDDASLSVISQINYQNEETLSASTGIDAL